MNRATIRAMHPSMIGANRRWAIRPQNMDKRRITSDQMDLLQELALEMFADMTNAGATFQESLAAILLSGMDFGRNAGAEPHQGRGGGE